MSRESVIETKTCPTAPAICPSGEVLGSGRLILSDLGGFLGSFALGFGVFCMRLGFIEVG